MARDEPTEDAEPESPPPSPKNGSTWRARRLGPYEPIAEIARGGMGAVFVARARAGPAAGTDVALKILRRDLAATHRRAFLREARVTSSLDHPNVVRTLDVGEAGEDVYLAMELVIGVTLAQLLARLAEHEIPPSPWVAAFIVASAARGLHAAHELCADDGAPLGLVHRDISPQNILLDFDGRVLLADFGIAKFAHDGTTSVDGTLKGKFSYMSPEQIRADSLDRRSDVFGLGAVLYEALTGEHAFGGRGPAEIVAQVLHGGVHDPREKRPDLPDHLARATARCLATERDDRYPTVAAVAADLEVALADAPEPPADVLADLLGEYFAKERERFARVRLRPPAPTRPSKAESEPLPAEASALLDHPGALDSGEPRPQATLPSAISTWSVPRKGQSAALTPPSVRWSEPTSLVPSPWRGRVTWMLAAIVAMILVGVLVLAAGDAGPPASASATAVAPTSAPKTEPAMPTPVVTRDVAPLPSPQASSTGPVVAPAAPSPPARGSAPVVDSATGRPAPRPPRPPPSPTHSGGVFREW